MYYWTLKKCQKRIFKGSGSSLNNVKAIIMIINTSCAQFGLILTKALRGINITFHILTNQNNGTESLSNLPKIIQQVSSKSRIWT